MSFGERWSGWSHWSCEGPDTGVGYGAGRAGVRVPSTRNKKKMALAQEIKTNTKSGEYR
jgi:hypothetical protein